MNIIGKSVVHDSFGKGVVADVRENIILIKFTEGEKKFLFPDSFSRFITFEDKDEQKKVNALIRRNEFETIKKDKAFKEAHERLQRLRCLKISPNSQGIFGLIANTPEEIFSSWNVFAGRYLSGYSKGEPRVPSRLAPNSICLFTLLPEGKTEKERKIIGGFMVRDDFYGADCTDGVIPAHENYRLKLAEGETPYYWDYFDTGETPPSWGGVEIKYCSNTVVRKILRDIMLLTEETPRYDDASRLYRYYCKINRLEEEPKPKVKKIPVTK